MNFWYVITLVRFMLGALDTKSTHMLSQVLVPVHLYVDGAAA